MDQSQRYWGGEFTVRSPYDGFAMKMMSFREAGSPPKGMERMYIVCGEGSAISTAEDLRGVLCLEALPKLVKTTTVPDSEKEGPAREISVLSIPYREYSILKQRSLLSEGPTIDSSTECQQLSKFVTIGTDTIVSKFVSALILSTYPPRSLNHLQTCDAKACCLSSSAILELSRLNLLLETPASATLAMGTVLSNPELLEQILLQLDIRTLLVSASRVCKHWSEVIDTSPSIQRALFFQPAEGKPEGEALLNPLLVKAFGAPFFDLRDQGPKRRSANCFLRLPWAPSTLGKIQAPERSISKAEPSCRQRSFTRSGASWRRMLVSQPPPPFIGFRWRDSDLRMTRRRNPVRLVESLTDPSRKGFEPVHGLAMGQLYDLVFNFTTQEKYFGLCFRIWWGRICERDSPEILDHAPKTTTVVAEFDERESRDTGPLTVDAIAEIFRCEEFVHPIVAGGSIIRDFNVMERHFQLGEI